MVKALDKIPFKVSFSSFLDETAAGCDLVLPNSLPLERYDDVATPYGAGFCVYSLVHPIQKPVHDTKTTADVILSLARKLSIDLKFDSFLQVLKEKVATLAKASGGFVAKDVMFQVALIRPQDYQVIATTNLNGDYISDALAAQVGGLGLAPGVNMVTVRRVPEEESQGPESDALIRATQEALEHYGRINKKLAPETILAINSITAPGRLADAVMKNSNFTFYDHVFTQ